MGFPKGASAEALRQSNNDITNSLQVFYLKSAFSKEVGQYMFIKDYEKNLYHHHDGNNEIKNRTNMELYQIECSL